MTLAEHARRELDLAGVTADDPAMADSIVKAVEAVAAYGHSGGSHSWAVNTLARLLHYETLTPLTTNPAEWMSVDMGNGQDCWQSCRRSEAFSEDGGKTYYLLSEQVNNVRPLHNALTPDEARMLAQPDADTEAAEVVCDVVGQAGYRVAGPQVDVDEERLAQAGRAVADAMAAQADDALADKLQAAAAEALLEYEAYLRSRST